MTLIFNGVLEVIEIHVVQGCIKLSAVVHELSYQQRKNLVTMLMLEAILLSLLQAIKMSSCVLCNICKKKFTLKWFWKCFILHVATALHTIMLLKNVRVNFQYNHLFPVCFTCSWTMYCIWMWLCCVAGIGEFVRSDSMTFYQMKSALQGSVWSVGEDSALDDYVFNWPEHRCLLFNHLYPDIGSLLEDEFQSVLSFFTAAQVPAVLDSDQHVAIGDWWLWIIFLS